MVLTIFIHCQISFCYYLIEDFHILFIRDNDLELSCDFCIWFCYGNTGLIKWIGMCFSTFGKSLWRICINFSLNVGQNSVVKPPGSGFFYMGRFLSTNPISSLAKQVYSDYLFILVSVSIVCVILKNFFPFHLTYLICFLCLFTLILIQLLQLTCGYLHDISFPLFYF